MAGAPLNILLYILIKQAVARTVPQQSAMDGGQAYLHVPLRIQPPQLKAVSPQQGEKGDIVLLLHHVAAGNEQFSTGSTVRRWASSAFWGSKAARGLPQQDRAASAEAVTRLPQSGQT